jgi:hypothetical protein
MTGRRALGLGLVAVALAACTSPEATRMRGGGPGGDTGNRDRVVEMHEGAEPYWRTPRLLADELATSTRTARQPDRSGGGAPSASPRP